VIARQLSPKIRYLAGKFPIISLTGPRQSGKTTLIRQTFAEKPYFSLEDPDIRRFASEDPRAFLSSLNEGAILDEVQRVPELFSYIQTIVDDHKISGEFILSGSQNFLLMESISQSLAGRVAVIKLLPFSNHELSDTNFSVQSLEERLFTGTYPRIYDQHIDPNDFYPGYIQTYVERDLRQLKSIHDLDLFSRFIRLCAARIGQLINFSSLASDCGISHFTAQSWLSLLHTSYILYLLPPHFDNFSKRLVKMPKLYFYDTGLVSHLLGIKESGQLLTHSMRGPLFENMVINEWLKHFINQGMEAPAYFWRDKTGHEVDLLLDLPEKRLLIEIKSAQTYHPDFRKNLDFYNKISGGRQSCHQMVVYAGNYDQRGDSFSLTTWQNLLDFVKK
jgi:uncharacterized protein